MRSNNPVFARSEEFNRATTPYSDPSQWTIDLSGDAGSTTSETPTRTDRMTIDTVVEKTGITLGLVAAAAAVTWFLLGDLAVDEGAVARAYAFAMGGAIIGLGLSLVNSFKKVVNPAFVMAYALVEGVFVGAFSKIISTWVGQPSIVFQAVLGTIIAFAGTLAAYKFFNIQVTDKFRRVVTISVFAFVGVVLVNFVLSMFGVFESGGLRGFNTLGLIVSAIAVVLAVFMLILDFDYVEQGVAAGLPQRESWRAAFGLTVTLIWLYIEILRILAIFANND
ncbi:Bax inhibitor-1/YccA family protein [Aeromicrobium phragmitis]|uniref:Bax inhibitor-1/YccA family protein n=1 Tax=Aeromicrobium phragmitis TaxID=2478914 RepID=A0A3L8PME4_9ACTN|nr:Bax inhibitor-1/YccA family protein [Aeromicrobium phragmitis]RLV55708.1 Bax inhibitor-1/YccA family protein [Aeromicrobium phragmitis]